MPEGGGRIAPYLMKAFQRDFQLPFKRVLKGPLGVGGMLETGRTLGSKTPTAARCHLSREVTCHSECRLPDRVVRRGLTLTSSCQDNYIVSSCFLTGLRKHPSLDSSGEY